VYNTTHQKKQKPHQIQEHQNPIAGGARGDLTPHGGDVAIDRVADHQHGRPIIFGEPAVPEHHPRLGVGHGKGLGGPAELPHPEPWMGWKVLEG
jgi:hypothetical protein